jgi:hypothetical protein
MYMYFYKNVVKRALKHTKEKGRKEGRKIPLKHHSFVANNKNNYSFF